MDWAGPVGAGAADMAAKISEMGTWGELGLFPSSTSSFTVSSRA